MSDPYQLRSLLYENPEGLSEALIVRRRSQLGSEAYASVVLGGLPELERFRRAGTWWWRLKPKAGAAKASKTSTPMFLHKSLEQPGRKPSCGGPEFSVGYRPLRAGALPSLPWPRVGSRMQDLLDSCEYDQVTIDYGPDRHVAVGRVKLQTPLFVLWEVCDTVPRAEHLARHGWHLWRQRQAGNWHRPDHLAPASAAGSEPLIATWLCNTPKAAAATVLHWGLDVEQRRARGSWRVHVQQPPDYVLASRRRQLEALTAERAGLARGGFTGWQNPVAGQCTVCGQPLRDLQSVQRGIGPTCYERMISAGVLKPSDTLELTRADVPAQRWVGAMDVEDWRASLPDVA